MEVEKLRMREWLPAVLAGIALLAFVAVFATEIVAYQHAVVGWARRDLASRAALAAATLSEPLRTEDFQSLRAFAAQSEAEGVRLIVRGLRGGLVFDSAAASGTSAFFETARAGEYEITLGVEAARVLAPFRRALVGFALSALVGMAGVLLFFFVTYRQRVRIRELKRIERFRRDFIADVSHEIKTPLTGILGAMEMMDEGGESGGGEQWNALRSMLKKEAKRLNGLVQSILDLARLEREGEALSLEETELGALVGETVGSFRPEAETKGIELQVEVPPGEVWAKVDAQRIEEALGNLVANALRHSSSPLVKVSLAATGGEVRLTVEDRGVGIASEDAVRIFERFYRVDPARSAETGGAGLGLAIVRQIARLHGGEVLLEAVSPHGARFVLKISGVVNNPLTRR